MSNLPPLTEKIAKGAEGGHEFERLMNQLLLCFADRHNFQYEPTGSAGGDHGIDGLARGSVPGFTGRVAFQFKWLWDGIHKGNKSEQITKSLNRAAEIGDIRYWVLVTPHDLTSSEREWLLVQAPRKDLNARRKKRGDSELPELTIHHWGQARLELLLRDYCPALFARYYQHEARPHLSGYDGHDFREFAADYRRKVAIAYRRLRTIGLPPETLREEHAQTEIPLRDIFVPQTFRPEGNLEQRLSLAELLRAKQCCVFLGDPGMGKTTVLSFLALLFSGEAELTDFDPPAEVTPLLIPVRDLLQVKQQVTDAGFLEYLVQRARSDLSLPHAHVAFFEATLRMGEAIVLIDGLDEAGGDVSRHAVSTSIQMFQDEFPQCTFWVTSRVYGYTRDVRLPKGVFSHYHVGRLESAQIDDFVARWYALQYPDNTREREDRVESLREAIQRSLSVQRLAGNPLLLTLMAFIHYGQRTLPQDRGELYEQCIQMLLKSWQDAKRPTATSTNQSSVVHPFENLGLHVATQKDYLAHLAMRAQQLNAAAEEDEGRGLIRRTDALDCLAQRHLDRSRRTRPEMHLAEAREEMEQLLDYVSDRTGLLIDKGGGQLSFIHLSFQEYLSAWLYTCQEPSEANQREFFEKHLGIPAWEEILLLRLYIILHGGGGENLFDAVISSLLRKLERHSAPAAWLTLARAVRDNLEFSARDSRTILQQTLVFWLQTPPRFEGDWFTVLKEVCLFAPGAKGTLQSLLLDAWQHREIPQAAACLHLAERLGLIEGTSHIDERTEWDSWLYERKPDRKWHDTLSFVFDCLVAKLSPSIANDLPRLNPTQHKGNPVWRRAIRLGDHMRGLSDCESSIPGDLARFFQDHVFRAIDQEVAASDRNSLAVRLGWLGDPRIDVDLRVKTHPEKHPAYVKIRAGNYYVGDEKTQIAICAPFWLSKYPVTNSQYKLFMKAGGYTTPEFWSDEGWRWVRDGGIEEPDFAQVSKYGAPNQPVVGVSWWEAEAFCQWAGVRLPTGREWEVAARGPKGLEYPWGNDWEDGICNSYEASLASTSAVGVFPRDCSPFDVIDMAGNVWEWCQDPWSPQSTVRVIRGGSWTGGARVCRAAGRSRGVPLLRVHDLGFRVAAVPPGGPSQEPAGE